MQMKFFGSRAEAAGWADGLLSAEGGAGQYRSLVVHDAGNITLVLEQSAQQPAGGGGGGGGRCVILSQPLTCCCIIL